MFSLPIKAFAVATSLGLSLLAANPTACAPGGVPVDASGRTPSCDTNVYLKLVIRSNGPAIEEDAKTQCIHTPTSFNVALTLFRITDAGPVQISDSMGRLNNACGDIPVVGATIDCIWYVAPCIATGTNTYQGLASINGEGPSDDKGDMEFFTWESKSPPTPLRCR